MRKYSKEHLLWWICKMLQPRALFCETMVLTKVSFKHNVCMYCGNLLEISLTDYSEHYHELHIYASPSVWLDGRSLTVYFLLVAILHLQWQCAYTSEKQLPETVIEIHSLIIHLGNSNTSSKMCKRIWKINKELSGVCN